MVFTKNIHSDPRDTIMQRHAKTSSRRSKQNSKSLLLTLLGTFFLIMFMNAANVLAADEPTRTLDFADFKTTSDGGVEIRLALSESPPTPTDFTSKNPAKLSIDLTNTKNNLPWSLPLPIDVAGVKSLKASQANNRTRISIEMDSLKTYKIRTEGNNVFVKFDGTSAADTGASDVDVSASTAAAAAPKPAPAPAPVAQAPAPAPQAAPRRAFTGAGNALESISFNKLEGEKLQFKINFSRNAVEPGSFTIDNPARIALDFPNTGSALAWKNKNVGIGFAKSITAVEAGNRTRVIINLVQLLPFETEVSGRSVYLTLAGAAQSTAKEQVTPAGKISTAVPGDDTLHNISNIDFRRGPNGEGQIIVTLSDANTPASTGESGNKIFVDFGNSGIANDLLQRLDVIDFATPVQYIDATRVGNRVRLSITPAGDYEYLAYHAGETYTIEVKPIVKTAEAKEKEEKGQEYTGEKLSLNFQDIEVRAVLQLIADFTGLNMVTSDSVKGNLTLRLKNVPWDQALDIVLKTKGLAMRRSGNVIMVAPSEEIAAREKLELEAKKSIETLEPLRSDILQVNYAKASEVATILKSKGTGVMSDRGTATVDVRTNSIIIVDTRDRLESARKMVARLDVPVRQVMIESRIVIADDNFAKDLGVRFGFTGVHNDTTLGTTSGSLNSTDVILGQGIAFGTPLPTPVSPGSVNDRLNVNLPASPGAGQAGRIAFGILGANTLLDLELSALESDGRGEVISNPRVVTANQKEAVIKQGTEIPYQEASSSGATSVSFKDAVLELKVTPQIAPNDNVILDLAISKDSVGAQIAAGVPVINTKEVKTQVLVDNGATVVLGGIYEQEKIEAVAKVPFLGDLPFLGALFRNKVYSDDKNELLIFVTPKVLKQSLSATTEAVEEQAK